MGRDVWTFYFLKKRKKDPMKVKVKFGEVVIKMPDTSKSISHTSGYQWSKNRRGSCAHYKSHPWLPHAWNLESQTRVLVNWQQKKEGAYKRCAHLLRWRASIWKSHCRMQSRKVTLLYHWKSGLLNQVSIKFDYTGSSWEGSWFERTSTPTHNTVKLLLNFLHLFWKTGSGKDDDW